MGFRTTCTTTRFRLAAWPPGLALVLLWQYLAVPAAADGLEFGVTAQEIDEDVGSLTPTRIAIRLAQPVRVAQIRTTISPADIKQKP